MSRFKIIETAQKQHRASSLWLKESISFNLGLYLDEKFSVKVDQLFSLLEITGYNKDRKRHFFEVVLANLLNQEKRPINISLNSNDWSESKYNKFSYTIVSEVIRNMDAIKFMNVRGGFRSAVSRMTRIWPTEKLLKEFPEYNSAVLERPTELVILKDNDRKLKDYTDTKETRRVRGILTDVNEVNERADIRLHEFKLKTFLVAIYKEELYLYGRLHSRGFRHFQGYSKNDREDFTINGEPTVELDFSGLHPNLLYAEKGIQLSTDPYLVICDDSSIRPFLKHVLLCMLNAESIHDAALAADDWFSEKKSKKRLSSEEQLKKSEENKVKSDIRLRMRSLKLTSRRIIAKFFEAHEPIEDFFCNGKLHGLKIMNKDAKIALDVVNHFAKKDIPILAIHDSFIVQRQYMEELREVMQKAYSKHTGGFSIEIKALT